MDSISSPAPVTVDWLAQMVPGCVLESNSNAVRATLGAGQLRVEMLSPPQPFVSRKPASLIIDKPAKFINTYAVEQTSTAATFAVLLEPGAANAPLPALQHQIAGESASRLHMVIQAASWTDDVFWSKDQASIDVPLPGKAKSTVNAGMVTYRTRAHDCTSLCATGVRELQLLGLRLAPSHPCHIALEKMPDGSWVLDSDRDLQGSIVCEPGVSIHAEKPSEVTPCRLIISNSGSNRR
jgi:hypothetical protein